MQDKGIVDDDEEVKHQDKKEAPTKDGKAFAFRKMKQSKKEKSESRKTTNSKNSPSKSSYEGEGVAFKAKLIGLESIPDARGDKMCQEAMIKLKVNVKNSGTHKKKINICVSLQGIKIKEEKTGVVLYHHPVNLISFISQDITDARAFGYVFGSSTEPHQFIAIKTDKPAFHVVLALRDLFQTVLSRKQEAIDNVKEQKKEETIVKDKLDEKVSDTRFTTDLESMALEGTKSREENIYFEVLMTEPLEVTTEDPKEPIATIDDLLGLESEMNQLKEGINSMDTSIAAAAAFNSEVTENDPFDTSFVLRPKRDSFTMPMPTPVSAATTSGNLPFSDPSDKYAVFSAVDTNEPSIFEKPLEAYNSEELLEDGRPEVSNLAKYSSAAPPPKPPRTSKDLSIFADLDPLGKDRPYKDKTEFFQDVKNPPKKVLNDLVDPAKDASKSFDVSVLSSSTPFPVDFESMSPSHAPTSNGFGPKLSNSSGAPNLQLKSLPTKQLTVDCATVQQSSSPIPIPSTKENRSFSNGSPYSKSPQFCGTADSTTDYYTMSSYTNSEGNSPTGQKENKKSSAVSRPRPRPSLNNKGGCITNRTVSSQSLSSDSSSDYEAISRENMQSIANVLLSGGHRLRAQSLCIESNTEFKLKLPGEKTIFTKKNDPFADDFFFSLPKKNNVHLTKTEFPECV